MSDGREGIAVLIPALNEAADIAQLLAAVGVMDVAEIVVADGASADATVAIAQTFPGVRVIQAPRGRGNQINAAAAAARSPILLIVHVDTRLPKDAPRLIRETLSGSQVAAGCFRLAFDRRTLGLDLSAWCSRFETRFTTFGDQCYFMRAETFHAVGGAPDWPMLEDVALRQRLLTKGRFIKRYEEVITSARRFTKHGVVRQQLCNCAMVIGYACGVPVVRLAKFYGEHVR